MVRELTGDEFADLLGSAFDRKAIMEKRHTKSSIIYVFSDEQGKPAVLMNSCFEEGVLITLE
ncbi:hypothetical protein [Crenobacter intestini]|uniref:Uncharacterized protein n=1 Tax=Crenobacter intestini TaxID=2563443 RepID=A0A4T0V234_9NEIS|nr:hypothetical protein [Crenobacter intestini]TIC85216.1 hypothetical protein E5K04_04245 [Crenobacter intestini]